MDKFRFALKHFVFSVLIFSLVTIILILLWYPAPYFMAAGGWQGLRIAAPIDLILGPLLAFIVFNKKKGTKKLIGDMTVIVILQLLALGLGVNTIYQQRPIANVYWDWEKSFFNVSAADLIDQGYDIDKVLTLSGHSPALVVAKKPMTVEQVKVVKNKIDVEGIAPFLQTDLYTEIENNFGDIKNANIRIEDFILSEYKVETIYRELIKKNGGMKGDYLFIPLYAKYQDLALVFTKNGEYVTTVVLRDKN